MLDDSAPALPEAGPSMEASSSAMQSGEGQDMVMSRPQDVPELSENPKPSKHPRLNVDTVGFVTVKGEMAEVGLLVACDECPCSVVIRKVTYAHEDEHMELTFGKDEVDGMEDHGAEFDYEDGPEEVLEGDLNPELCKPRSSDIEPECDPEELELLDSMADMVELGRLVSMGVLIKQESESDVKGSTQLTTKMVRTWRPKELGNPPEDVWYRRSRFVAREYAWLSERTDIFAPASLCNRLIPILFMREKQRKKKTGSMTRMRR